MEIAALRHLSSDISYFSTISADLCPSVADVLRVYVAKSGDADGLGLGMVPGRGGIKDVVSGRLPSSQRSGKAAQFLINTALNLATKALDVYQKLQIIANCPKTFSLAYPRRNLVGF